jgi:hypothetical protein
MFSLKSLSVPKKYLNELEELGNTEEVDAEVARQIEDAAMEKWIELANINLGSSSENYINSMRSEINGTKVILSLDGDLANMQEKGRGPFDMKPGLLADHPDGLNVPIASSAPGKGGPNPLSKNMYARIKRGIKRPGDRFAQRGGRRTRSYDKSYLHKAPKYQGLTKSTKFWAKKTGAEYVTFRKVSKNSDPNSWWHPGFEALDLMKQVQVFIKEQAPEIMQKVILNRINYL